MTYTAGYGEPVVTDLARRTAAGSAAFFAPHLRPGMTLLDCGCGPGTITLDLARIVSPGCVTGVDIQPTMVDRARATATEQSVENAVFLSAHADKLPFDDASFDSIFAHALLEHVTDQQAVLHEMYRVLVPGGVIGIRDADHGGILLTPDTAELEEAMDLWKRLWRHNGGDPYLGRKQRGLLRAAGFNNVTASASFDYCGVEKDVRTFAEMMAYQFSSSENAKKLVGLEWATPDLLTRITSAWQAWGANPDAFFARPRCEAVGWKP